MMISRETELDQELVSSTGGDEVNDRGTSTDMQQTSYLQGNKKTLQQHKEQVDRLSKVRELKNLKQAQIRRDQLLKNQFKTGVLGVESTAHDSTKCSNQIYQAIRAENA